MFENMYCRARPRIRSSLSTECQDLILQCLKVDLNSQYLAFYNFEKTQNLKRFARRRDYLWIPSSPILGYRWIIDNI